MAPCYTRPMSTKRLQLVTIIIIIVFSGLSVVTGAQYSPQMCPVDYDYSRQVNKCYKVHTDATKDWKSAREHCQSEGADLVVVPDNKANTIVKDLATNYDPRCFWIGAVGSESTSKWIDDTPMTFDVGVPAFMDQSEVHCVGIMKGYVWTWMTCSSWCKYICEKKAEMSPLCPFGYVSNARKDMCYKVQTEKYTFEESRSLCQEEKGGDLVIITDTETKEFIINLLDPLMTYESRYWIGLEHKGNHEYKWFDGSSLQKSDDTNFNNELTYASCATLEFYKARYTDEKCSEGHLSICQTNISTTYPVLDCPLGYAANVTTKAGLITCLMVEDFSNKTWSQAKNICSSVGGELFTFDSDDYGIWPFLGGSIYWSGNESSCQVYDFVNRQLKEISCAEKYPYICRHSGYIRMLMNLSDPGIISNQEEQIVDDVCQSPNGTASFSLRNWTLMKFLQRLVESDCVYQKGQDKCCAEVTFSKPGYLLDQTEIEMKVPMDKRSCLCPEDKTETQSPTKHITDMTPSTQQTTETTLPRVHIIDMVSALPTERNPEKTSPTEWNTEKTSPTEWNTEKTSPTEWNTEKTSPTEWNREKTSPTEWNREKTSPTEWNREKTSPTEWNREKTSPTEWYTEMTSPTEWITEMTSPIEQNTEMTQLTQQSTEMAPLIVHIIDVVPTRNTELTSPTERNEEIASPIKKETFNLLRNITTPKNDSTPQNNLCPCRCDSLKIDFNPSPEALSLMIANIQKELKVETEKLSSKRNKKISAKDNRVESSAIGYVGIALCLVPLGLLVAIDISRLFQPRN